MTDVVASRKPRRGAGTTQFLTRRGPGRSGGSVPTVPSNKLYVSGYRWPKAGGMRVRGDLRGAAVYRSADAMLT
jgi:hypothetical protein